MWRGNIAETARCRDVTRWRMCSGRGRSTTRLWLKPRPPASGSGVSATPCCFIHPPNPTKRNNRGATLAGQSLNMTNGSLFSDIGLKIPSAAIFSAASQPAGALFSVLHRGDSYPTTPCETLLLRGIKYSSTSNSTVHKHDLLSSVI